MLGAETMPILQTSIYFTGREKGETVTLPCGCGSSLHTNVTLRAKSPHGSFVTRYP